MLMYSKPLTTTALVKTDNLSSDTTLTRPHLIYSLLLENFLKPNENLKAVLIVFVYAHCRDVCNKKHIGVNERSVMTIKNNKNWFKSCHLCIVRS